MLRRSITVFLILAILLSVSVCAFAAEPVDIWSYAEFEVDGFTKNVTITFPHDWTRYSVYKDNTYLGFITGGSGYYDFTDSPTNKNLKVQVLPLGTGFYYYSNSNYDGRYLDLSVLPVGSVLSISSTVYISPDSGSISESAVIDLHFLEAVYADGKVFSNIHQATWEYIQSDTWSGSYDYVVSDNTIDLVPAMYWRTNYSATGIVYLNSTFEIHTTIDALKQLEENTGKTNTLLEKALEKLDDITDREPEPVEPTWGESSGDASDKEEEILDQLDPDKVTNDLADIHLTLVDNLMLYTNAFAAISAIWVLLIDVPFIKIILYCSLLFGLLAAFLGMGMAAGRASDRRSGRSSGKKGK